MRINKLYDFDVEFCIEEVNKKIDEGFHVLDAYNNQPLIVALYKKTLCTPISWQVDAESYFVNSKGDMHEISLSHDYGRVTFQEMHNDLNSRLIDNFSVVGVPQGYELMQTQVYIKARSKFKNLPALMSYKGSLK